MDNIDTISLLALIGLPLLAGSLFIWWGLRPLAWVYRIDNGELEVFSFLFFPARKLKLEDIEAWTLVDPKTLRSLPPRSIRWRTSGLITPSSQFLLVTLADRSLVFPAWLLEVLEDENPEARLMANSRDRLAGRADAFASMMEKAVKPPFRRFLVWFKSRYPTLRNLGRSASPCSAIILTVLPLWLTWMDFAGFQLLKQAYGIPSLRWEELFSHMHFVSSLFMFMCGLALILTLWVGRSIPLALAVAGCLAGVWRMTSVPDCAHDLSHMVADSCTGYNDILTGIGGTCLLASILVVMGAWDRPRAQGPSEGFGAATPL